MLKLRMKKKKIIKITKIVLVQKQKRTKMKKKKSLGDSEYIKISKKQLEKKTKKILIIKIIKNLI
jgi:hypothetical protein